MKKLTTCLLIFLLFAFCVKAQKGIDVFQEKHRVNELRKDIEAVKATLEDKDANLYWYISKKQLNRKFDSLEAAITAPITNSAFRFKLACVLASIGDGHMSLKFDADKLYSADKAKFDGSEVFPIQKFNYKVIGDKLFIVDNLSEDKSIIAGAEVVAINDKPASEIIRNLLSSISSDGYNQTFKYFYLNAKFADKYQETFGFDDLVTFSLKVDADVKKVDLKKSTSIQKFNAPNTVGERKSFLARYAYIRVGSFNEPNSLWVYPNMFSAIKKSGINKLVLDLRNNNGGSQKEVIALFSYLIDSPTFFAKKFKHPTPEEVYGSETPIMPNEAHFAGKIYVLINGGTFSAASLIAANLRANKKVTFIGEETGGGGNKCTGGSFEDLSLPNTGLLLSFGVDALILPKGMAANGRGIMPDIPLAYQLKDYLDNRDLEFEWVKQKVDNWQ